MKSAMQELIDFLEPELKMHDFSQLPAYEKAKELLEKEKQQIIEAVDKTFSNTLFEKDGDGYLHCPFDGEYYYKITFEQ
jgi:hypothetical protein